MSKKHYKIAIVGAKEAIIGFKAVGFEIIACQDKKEAVEILYKLKKQSNSEQEGQDAYGIVFVTEDLAKDIPLEDYRKITDSPFPAVIALPSHKGSTGFGLTRLKRIVERAVGSDILK